MEVKYLVLISLLAHCSSSASPPDKFGSEGEVDLSSIDCPPNDGLCEQDKMGYNAIQQLHLQIDDDNDGSLDRTESDEFLRDELKYTDGFERHSAFHGHDDLISVTDLWMLWVKSEVYNWTVDDVVDWVSDYVELPQYAHNFKVNAVDGRMLPRLAANTQFMTSILGIKNAVHKQKLVLKAMDTVLFGAPKYAHNWAKDVALVASLLVALGGCWLAYVQNKYSQNHLRKVMKDLDSLQKAEDSLQDLQKKLETAEKDQIDVIEEKRTLERKYESEINEAKAEADKLKTVREDTLEEVQRLKIAEQELDQVRRALRKAEKELEDRQNAPLAELQQWLQVTYEIESKHYDAKREAVERHLVDAKDMCEKIRKKKSAFLGSLRVAHTTSMDDTDHAIMSAKAALEEIRMDLQERSHRWQEVEKICGFNIVMNPGLPYLEQLLSAQSYPGTSGGGVNGRGNSAPLGLEDADEDAPPGYLTATVAFHAQQQQSEDMLKLGMRTSPVALHHHRKKKNRAFKRTLSVPGAQSLAAASGMEARVWPNLMQAGMQLTMLGLGLTNNQAMSLVPGHANYKGPRQPGLPQSHPAEKRLMTTSLTQAYSSSALNSGVNSASVHPLTAVMQPHPLNLQRVPTGVPQSQNQDSPSESEPHRQHVEFNLGDNSPSTEAQLLRLLDDDMRERAGSFGRTSGDTARQRPKALTLSTSRSETALSSHLVGGHRAVLSAVNPPTMEEESSPESTADSSSIASTDDKTTGKKKKKKLLHKLLGKDKSKVS